MPFPLEGDDLPPLDIPRFRWWKCSNCILEVGATPKLMLLTSKSDDGGTNVSFLHKKRTTGRLVHGFIHFHKQKNFSFSFMGHGFDVVGLVIGADDPEINVSSSESECDERNQASCSHIGIPDLNEPFIETPSPTQRDDFEYRSSALLRFSVYMLT